MGRKMGLRYLYKKGLPSALAFLFMLGLTSCSMVENKEALVIPPIIVDKSSTDYTVHEVTKGDIADTVKRNASVVTIKEITVNFGDASGLLETIHVRMNDRVKKGDILAELSTDDIKEKIEKSQVELEKALLYLDLDELEYQNIAEQVESARDELKRAVDPEAKARIEDELLSLKRQSKSKESELAGRRFNIQSMKKELEKLRNALNDAKLYAPIDGIISYVTTKTSEEDIPLGHTIFKILDPSKLYVRYQPLNPDELARHSFGMKIQVGIRDSDNKETLYDGEIAFIDRSEDLKPVEETTKTKVLAWVEDLPEHMRIGDPVTAYVTFVTKKDTIVIPKKAIYRNQGRDYVELLIDDNTKIEQDVVVGLSNVDDAEIISGLKEGDRIILK